MWRQWVCDDQGGDDMYNFDLEKGKKDIIKKKEKNFKFHFIL